MPLLNYEAIEALATIVSEGNFAKAARALHVTQSAISQRLRTLEDHVGQPLLRREQPPTTTALGRALIAHLEQVRRAEWDILGGPEVAVPSYPLAVNADSLATWFLESARKVLERADVMLEIISDDEHHTHKLLERGDVLACVSSEEKPPLGCDTKFLGVMRYYCVATPRFVRRYFGKGFSPETAQNAPTLLFSRKDSLHERFFSTVLRWKANRFRFHLVPSSQGYFEVVSRGHAYGIAPDSQVRQPLRSGKLVDLCPGKYIDVPYYWHYARFQPAYGRTLSEQIIEASAVHLRRPTSAKVKL